MLTADMREKATGRIELKNMTLKTGQGLLYYLYNNQLKEDTNLMELLAVAAQYELPRLKALCAESLAASVTKDNCAELLRLAELFEIKQLKDKVIEFTVKNATNCQNCSPTLQLLLKHTDLNK
jgi:hypothetical protein